MVKWLILCGNEENWDVSIKHGVWGVKPNLRRLWNDVLDGDIVFFYVTRAFKRVMGVGRVREKLDPQVYPPKPLWPDEIRERKVIYPYRFRFEPFHVCDKPSLNGIGVNEIRISKQKGMSRIIDKEAIDDLYQRVKSSWGVDLPLPEGIPRIRARKEEIEIERVPVARVFFPLDPTISEVGLQDYVEGHSEVVEPELRLVTRDYRTSRKNIIDFLFRDIKNNYVVLETKTRIDRSVFGQVGEYIADIRKEMAEKENVGVRGIILATTLDDKMMDAAKEFGLTAMKCELVGRKIVCPKCGTEGRQGDRYCGRCGTKLLYPKPICPSCGLENVEGDVYCRYCRTKLV